MLKQLRDDGFSVTGYERRGRVGGLWAYSEDLSHTSVLPSKFYGSLGISPLRSSPVLTDRQEPPHSSASTRVASVTTRCQRVSRSPPPTPQQKATPCSDVSYAEYPIFLRAHQFQEYMEDYAKHFDTLKHWVFDTAVRKTYRNGDDTKWCLEVETYGESKTVEFDKVVFCHGYQTKAVVPQFEGQDAFEGVIVHSQQYRRSVAIFNPLCPSQAEATRTHRESKLTFPSTT